MSFPRLLAGLVVACGLLAPLWSPAPSPRPPPPANASTAAASDRRPGSHRSRAPGVPPQSVTPAVPLAAPWHGPATAADRGIAGPLRGLAPLGRPQDGLDAAQWLRAFRRERGVPRLVHAVRRLFPDCISDAGPAGCSAFRLLATPPVVSFRQFGLAAVPPFPAALDYPDFPRLHGAGFKLLCDRVLKDRTKEARAQLLRPQQIANRSLVFVETGSEVRALLAMLPRIPTCFFLLTHNFNFPTWPARLLDSPKLLLWFSIHLGPGRLHPKLVAIPLGLPKRGANYSAQLAAAVDGRRGRPPAALLHARFRVRATNDNRRLERLRVMSALQANFPSITLEEVEKRIPSSEYLTEILDHRFVLSPPGHGPDCYRTWESLYLGRVPVVERRLQDGLLVGVPAVVVDNWHNLTPRFLNDRWAALARTHFNTAKLWLPWWVVHMLTLCLAVP